MDTEGWNVAEGRPVRKLQQIRQLLSMAFGPHVDLNTRPRTSLPNGKKSLQWKFGRLKLGLHCNTCCANTTKYAKASTTLKTRNGPAKSERALR
jgi:hypothetical protein